MPSRHKRWLWEAPMLQMDVGGDPEERLNEKGQNMSV